MQASRAPWWYYILAVSFLLSFALLLYNFIWGPRDPGVTFDSVGGYLTAKEIQPDKAAARAGLRAGDRILIVDGIPIRGAKGGADYNRAAINFESG